MANKSEGTSTSPSQRGCRGRLMQAFQLSMHLALWFTPPDSLQKPKPHSLWIKSTKSHIPATAGQLVPGTKELVKSKTLEERQLKHQVVVLGVAPPHTLRSGLPQLPVEKQVKPPSRAQGRRGGLPAGGNLLTAVTAGASGRSHLWKRAPGPDRGKRKTVH